MLARYTKGKAKSKKQKAKKPRVAEVTSAIVLTKTEQAKVKTWVKRSVGADVKIKFKVDPKVIAGLKVRAGDWLYNGTFSGELERAREDLIEG